MTTRAEDQLLRERNQALGMTGGTKYAANISVRFPSLLTQSTASAPWVAGLVLAATVACAHASPTSEAAGTRPLDTTVANTLTANELRRNPGRSVEDAMAGRIAGVRVTRNRDGTVNVQIRGGASILGSNEPLYVIDGIPITPGPNGALTGIVLNDIQSIQVLKDPVSAAMYGVRGANGVIVITTKLPGQ